MIEATGTEVEENFRYPGPYNRDVRVDYRLPQVRRPTAILTLGGSHAQANEVFRKWSDLRKSRVQDRFLTVGDDAREPEQPEDLERLEELSQVVSASNERGLSQLLLAA